MLSFSLHFSCLRSDILGDWVTLVTTDVNCEFILECLGGWFFLTFILCCAACMDQSYHWACASYQVILRKNPVYMYVSYRP